MTDKYVCGLCGTTHYDLDDYLKCVARCGKELKQREEAEKKRKRLEEVNTALNGIKQAKKYYEDLLDKFEENYPEEYKLNFGTRDTEEDASQKVKIAEHSYSKDDGKDTASAKLYEDPETEFILKLLGIL